MANKRYTVEKDLNITLSLKVRLKEISNYYNLSQEDIDIIINDLEDELVREFEYKLRTLNKIEDCGCDYIFFEIID